jgi:hypothetical protein
MAELEQDAVLALALLLVPEPGLALLLVLLAHPASPALAVSTAIAATTATVVGLITALLVRARMVKIKRIIIPNERARAPVSVPASVSASRRGSNHVWP